MDRLAVRYAASRNDYSMRPAAKVLGAATLGLAGIAALVQLRNAGRRAARLRRLPAQSRNAPMSDPAPAEARNLHASAALLAASVLTDSALEHYRGEFANPGMTAPLITSSMTLLAGMDGILPKSERPGYKRDGIYATAVAVGAIGSVFHLYDILRRPGGVSWANLFYAAPLGAPAALSIAGLLGLAAQRVRTTRRSQAPRLLGFPAGRVLAALTGAGLAGTSSEAGLLHFRGAFQNSFMWLPVTVPPVAAAIMISAAVRPSRIKPRFTRAWLTLTGFLGAGGVGFHAYGVARQMGGWRNWSQNVLSGPPLSAPPSFAALGLAGLAALSLLEKNANHEDSES